MKKKNETIRLTKTYVKGMSNDWPNDFRTIIKHTSFDTTNYSKDLYN